MRSLRLIVAMLAFAGLLVVFAPSAALASGCSGSAGDNQYVDPLQNCNQSTTPTSTTSTTPSTSTPTGTATTPTTSTTPTAAAADPTTTSTTAKDPKSSKTLPYTGLDIGPALLIAVTLLGGGIVLRRAVAER